MKALSLRGLTDEALAEVRDREDRLLKEAVSRASNIRREIVLAEKQLRDLNDVLKLLNLKAGEHDDNRRMAQAYLDMRHGNARTAK